MLRFAPQYPSSSASPTAPTLSIILTGSVLSSSREAEDMGEDTAEVSIALAATQARGEAPPGVRRAMSAAGGSSGKGR